MDNNTQLAIATTIGMALPFLLSIVKRYVPMSKQMTRYFVMFVSVMVAVTFDLASRHFSFNSLIADSGYILGISQAIYLIVMKSFGIDDKIEGNIPAEGLGTHPNTITAEKLDKSVKAEG